MTEQLSFHFSLSCIGEGNGNPFQCSCLENPRDRGAWWAAVYGVAQSWTRLKRLSSSSSSRKDKAIAMENRWVPAIGRSWVGDWLEGESVKDVLRGDVTVLQGFSDSSVGKESTCNAGDPASIPGLGRSPGEGIGYPLQYCWASVVAQNPPAMRLFHILTVAVVTWSHVSKFIELVHAKKTV